MKVTIDASVFISLVRPQERFNVQSRDFVRRVQVLGLEVICPSLVLPECAAAIARQTQDSVLVDYTLHMVETFPKISFAVLTVDLAGSSAAIARQCKLRGADSVYLATSMEYEAVFVTWDNEVILRFNRPNQVMTPTDWLAANQ